VIVPLAAIGGLGAAFYFGLFDLQKIRSGMGGGSSNSNSWAQGYNQNFVSSGQHNADLTAETPTEMNSGPLDTHSAFLSQDTSGAASL
jgi:hypothetical protein